MVEHRISRCEVRSRTQSTTYLWKSDTAKSLES
jgi:hypothetical protein